ncbi:MAG: hypothetical protein G01um101413_20 [Parcubacteria group bacterium Gr01-1014_13]|nr:MAG: hypothetical protein G01um101413_20 [Parcubacteria group bacterium Gr01-1014_13]
MFRHHKETTTDEATKKTEPTVANSDLSTFTNKVSAPEAAKAEPGLKELIEKNLKWSQIIYEQNRKINNKLLWTAIASWLKVLLILVPLVLAIWYLGPLLKDVISQYSELLGNSGQATSESQENSMSNLLLKWSNLDPAQQEQLKALFK